MIQPVPGDDFSLVALPLSFDGARPKIVHAPPIIGEHDKSFAAGERGARADAGRQRGVSGSRPSDRRAESPGPSAAA